VNQFLAYVFPYPILKRQDVPFSYHQTFLRFRRFANTARIEKRQGEATDGGA